MMEQTGESVKAVIHSVGKILLQLRDEKPIDALKRELLEEIGLNIKDAKLLFSWNHYKYNSVLHFFSVLLTMEFITLYLNEGQEMELFSIGQINTLPITPSLKKNLHKIDQRLFLKPN